jgi:transposase-like protein
MGSTRNFTKEYKPKAVTFVTDDQRSIAEVARNIDVHEMTLGNG